MHKGVCTDAYPQKYCSEIDICFLDCNRSDFSNLWIMFQFSSDISFFREASFNISRRKVFILSGKWFFFKFAIQAGLDIPAFSFIFIAVRNFNWYRLLSTFITENLCTRGVFFCHENFDVLFVLVLPRTLENFKHSKFKYCAVKTTV